MNISRRIRVGLIGAIMALVPAEATNYYVSSVKRRLNTILKRTLSLSCIYILAVAAAVPCELIFRSGFEANTRSEGGDLSTDIVGIDMSVAHPNDWVADLEGYPGIGNFSTGGFCAAANLTSNDHKVRITDDPTGALNSITGKTNQVLHMWNRNNNATACGWETRPHSDIDVDGKFPELLLRYRMYLHPDLQKWIGCPGWLQFWELKRDRKTTDSPYFTIQLMLNQDRAKDALFWRVNSRRTMAANTDAPWLWTIYNRDVPVPLGEWIAAEIYWKKGDERTGRFMFVIQRNGHPRDTIFNITGATVDLDNPDGNMYQYKFFTVYTGDGAPQCVDAKGGVLQIYWDDLELWTSFPPVNPASSLGGPDARNTPAMVAQSTTVDGVEFMAHLPRPMRFTFSVFDIAGNSIWNYSQSQAVSGRQRIFWHGGGVPRANGMYIGVLSAEGAKLVRLVSYR
jgi:hypothetical protein